MTDAAVAILSRQKSQAIWFGPLEDTFLNINKLQKVAPADWWRATLDNAL